MNLHNVELKKSNIDIVCLVEHRLDWDRLISNAKHGLKANLARLDTLAVFDEESADQRAILQKVITPYFHDASISRTNLQTVIQAYKENEPLHKALYHMPPEAIGARRAALVSCYVNSRTYWLRNTLNVYERISGGARMIGEARSKGDAGEAHRVFASLLELTTQSLAQHVCSAYHSLELHMAPAFDLREPEAGEYLELLTEALAVEEDIHIAKLSGVFGRIAYAAKLDLSKMHTAFIG